MSSVIKIENCRIENDKKAVLIKNLSWEMKAGEAWLVIGPNGGGKADFLNALAGKNKIIPNSSADTEKISLFSSVFGDSVEIVSLERAAKIIEEERLNDESEYLEGGVDIGRTGRIFIAEGICGKIKKGTKGTDLPEEVRNLEKSEAVKLCGVEAILERGVKYMSTGEIRRTLLARALISGKKLLILSDPFAGLDVNSRTILLKFFEGAVKNQNPGIIMGMERYVEIPETITNVLEFSGKSVSFCGTKNDYEKLLFKRKQSEEVNKAEIQTQFKKDLENVFEETKFIQNNEEAEESLIKMQNVNVGWGEKKVLSNLNWEVLKGQHWLIQGPNGSGKTTLLELITGDNKQVFCNDIWMFGNKRGSGESIWDIKKQLGIVSYRLHVEYRMLGSTSLSNVIVSGFRDSIGLYEAATDVETAAAKKWLVLGGFEGRESEMFGNLSYGEQRAILILRSVVKSPKIMILDEPCHGLDENTRSKILNLLEIIGKTGSTTMLHVTHDKSEILSCEKHILQLFPDENPMYKIENLNQ